MNTQDKINSIKDFFKNDKVLIMENNLILSESNHEVTTIDGYEPENIIAVSYVNGIEVAETQIPYEDLAPNIIDDIYELIED